MKNIFEITYKDESKLWCSLDSQQNYCLGSLGTGEAKEVRISLKSQDDIKDFIKYNDLCPNNFCENGFIDIGYNEKTNCSICNIF